MESGKKFFEIRKTVANEIDNIINQYIDKPVHLNSTASIDYELRDGGKSIEYYADASLLDENGKCIFGSDIHIYFRKNQLEFNVGTSGNFSKADYGQINRYIFLGKMLANIENVETDIQNIIESYKDEFVLLDEQLRAEMYAKEKAEMELRKQKHEQQLIDAENECKRLAAKLQIKVNHNKMIALKFHNGTQKRFKNWFDALRFVKELESPSF